MSRRSPRFDRYALGTVALAKALLGQRLVRVDRGIRSAGVIVETEAYLGGDDLGSHSAGGRRTPRNESMFLAGGHAYIYFVYGMHHCFNVVSGRAGQGSAVLVRAIEPTEGVDRMARRAGIPAALRRTLPARELARRLGAGPARLCRSLGLDRRLDREPLRTSERLFVERGPVGVVGPIVIGPRIGIHYAGEWVHAPLRFGIASSACLSRRFD